MAIKIYIPTIRNLTCLPDLVYQKLRNIQYTRDSETLEKHKITNSGFT